MEYEREYTPTEPQTDEVWVMDGKGHMIRLEVEDDVADD